MRQARIQTQTTLVRPLLIKKFIIDFS